MVLEKVKAILAEQFDYEEDKITPETTIADDLGADSLDVVDLLMSIEDEFEIEVPDEEIENIKTVGDLVKYKIMRKLTSRFREKNGSELCHELKGSNNNGVPLRECRGCVEDAATILEEILAE